jgi:hypothetical protein
MQTYVGARATRRLTAPVLQSRSLFRWQAARGLNALTGQTGAFSRLGFSSGNIDSNGTAFRVGASMPRWEMRDYYGTGARDTVGLRLGIDDLSWDCALLPQTLTVLVELSEAGTRTTSGGGLVYLGNDGQTGARLTLDSDGTNYRVTWHNGSTSVSATLATATPTTGQSAILVAQLEDTGGTQRVRLGLDVQRTIGETWTAWSGTVARAAAFPASTRVRANRVGSAGTQGDVWLRQIAIVSGRRTAQEIIEQL